MKSNLLFCIIFLTQFVTAQTFVEIETVPSFEGVSFSSCAIEDLNGDGNPDILISGSDGTNGITKLYLNDGENNFTETMDSIFTGVYHSSIAIADVNEDSSPDILITGWNNSVGTTKLYINDGEGNFTEKTNTPFVGVTGSEVALEDINGDDKPDALITGLNDGLGITKLYINEGQGDFLEANDTPFQKIYSGCVTIGDINGDNFNDILLAGLDGSNGITKLYLNNSQGVFTEDIENSFEGVYHSASAFADFDGDNDLDIIITGYNGSIETTKLYLNNSQGVFTQMPDTPFENVSHGSLSIADVNLDSFPDVFISGYNGSTRIAKLYINDSQGNFSELEGTPFQGVSYSSSAIEDINGDNHPDILITGWNSSTGTATLYGNNQIMSSVKETLPLTNFQFEIISNPIQSESIELKIYSQNSNIINISIFDLNGKLLKEQQIQLIEDEQSYFFDISRLKLNKGTYLLQLQDKESRSSKKIVIH